MLKNRFLSSSVFAFVSLTKEFFRDMAIFLCRSHVPRVVGEDGVGTPQAIT
jgi:hypothetical protein